MRKNHLFPKPQHLHFIGIGGIGISSIAKLCAQQGHRVTGSDLNPHPAQAEELMMYGINIKKGHHPDYVKGADWVIHSTAIPSDNPEIRTAHKSQIPVMNRAQILSELMRLHHGIAVSGAHGKTTTTSMIAKVLTDSEVDPTVVVGGRMDNFQGSNSRLGKGPFMVVEADESDGSFLSLQPTISVITNVDREHLDYYKTFDNLKDSFLKFARSIPFYGACIYNGDDKYLKSYKSKTLNKSRSFGFGSHNDLVIKNHESSGFSQNCEFTYRKKNHTLKLQVPGTHNTLNALAAFLVGDELNLSHQTILESLSQFQGVERRFQVKGQINQITFVDDYAHHPTEIFHTLQTARTCFPFAKFHVLFQPHRYSRTESLLKEFSHSFKGSHQVGLLDIYSAGEKPENLTLFQLKETIEKESDTSVTLYPSAQEGVETLMKSAHSGDVILTLGAGNIHHLYQNIF